MNVFLAKLAGLSSYRRSGKSGGVVGKAVGSIFGAPIGAVGDAIGLALLGPKAIRGPMRGKRLSPVKGGPGVGMQNITRHEFMDIIEKRTPGKAYSGDIGAKRYYFARKYRPGGIVGLAQKHPLMAGGALLLGHHLLKRPDHAPMAGELARGFLPEGPDMSRHANLQAALEQQQSYQNPLAQRVWSK